jgi:hypothetical protein
MSSILLQARPALIRIRPDLASVCLFSLLGLMLAAAILSSASSQTISVMMSFAG